MNLLISLFTETGIVPVMLFILTGIIIYLMMEEENR